MAWSEQTRARIAGARRQAGRCVWAIGLTRRARRARSAGVELPRWVPHDLANEFFEIAAQSGEEAAASHVRRLKREMEQAHE